MKLLSLLLALSCVVTVARARSETFYLGTYTDHTGSKGIYRCTLDRETGALSPVVFAAPAVDPSFIAFGPDGHAIYAAEETPGTGHVQAFARANDDSLLPLNLQSANGAGTCHVTVDPTGQCVLVTNYSSGSVACFRLQRDGSIGPRTAFIQFTGSGPNAQRQEAPHAHQVNVVGRNAYVCDLGTDEVWNLAFDPVAGTLTYNYPLGISLQPGSGPRHLAYAGNHLYVASELAGTITVFIIRNDTAAIQQTIPALPATTLPATRAEPAEIAISPNGKTLYVSNRGNDTISVFKIKPDGLLKFDETVPCGVKGPRSFAIDPSGQWLIAAGQEDNRLAVLAIKGDSGELLPPKSSVKVGSPVCVLFAPPAS